MAYWSAKQGKVIEFEPRDVPGHKGWQEIDCGCCGGLQWGGESPEECLDCHGSGSLFHHLKSGVLADYPGGPLRGKYFK